MFVRIKPAYESNKRDILDDHTDQPHKSLSFHCKADIYCLNNRLFSTPSENSSVQFRTREVTINWWFPRSCCWNVNITGTNYFYTRWYTHTFVAWWNVQNVNGICVHKSDKPPPVGWFTHARQPPCDWLHTNIPRAPWQHGFVGEKVIGTYAH